MKFVVNVTKRVNYRNSKTVLLRNHQRKKSCNFLYMFAYAPVPSKAKVLLLLFHCLMFLPLFVGVLCFGSSFLMHFLVSFLLMRKRKRVGCFTFIASWCLMTFSVIWLCVLGCSV